MAKRRKSSAAKAPAPATSTASPTSVPTEQPSTQTNAPNTVPKSNFTTSAGENLYNNVVAAVLAGIQIFSDGDRWTRIPIILGIIFVLFTLYVFASYVVIPILSLLKYPLSPVTWLLLKVYNVLYWMYSWVSWVVKGVAWLGFYIHFVRIFVGYVADVINGFFGAVERGYDEYQKEQEQEGGEDLSSPKQRDSDDDDENMPELVDP